MLSKEQNVLELKISNSAQTLPEENNPDNMDFKNKETLINFIETIAPKVSENFELTEYIDTRNNGFVYIGKSKNNYNKQLYCFSFFNRTNNNNTFQNLGKRKYFGHKNLSKIFGFYKKGGSFYLLSEYFNFGNLKDYQYTFLKRRVLPETFLCYIMRPITDALYYIQRNKFLYLDLREGNIALDPDLNIKLKIKSSLFPFKDYQPNDLITFPMIGPGRYMAPEILNHNKIETKYGGKIIIYSLGVTLYHLAFGLYPYGLNDIDDDDYDKIVETISKNKTLEFPTDITTSNMLKGFLMNLLEKDYKKRYSIKDALDDPWIKGWQIIEEEKENVGILEIFDKELRSNGIPKFNQYIMKKQDYYALDVNKGEKMNVNIATF